MYIYVYIYICMYVNIYVYIYIYTYDFNKEKCAYSVDILWIIHLLKKTVDWLPSGELR